MAQQTINIGASPNDGTGTPLRTAFQYTNSNFSELYTAVGPSGNNIVVPGNATITGDLTVDTNVLKVDTTNNRVGILTASPAQAVDVASGNLQVRTGGTVISDTFTNYGAALQINAAGSLPLRLQIGGSNAYEITSANVHTWQNVGGVAGTAMTLNATGLGVGASPLSASKLTLNGGTGDTSSQDSIFSLIRTSSTGNVLTGKVVLAQKTTDFGNIVFRIKTTASSAENPAYYTDALTIDGEKGNVGIGVTPSAITTGRGLEVGAVGNGLWCNNSSFNQLLQNAYFSSASATGWKYAAAASTQAVRVQLGSGEFNVFNAPAGTAGTDLTWTQRLTLDASGRLLVGPTSANTSGGVLQLSSGITFPATQVASSDANTLDDYEEGTFTATLKGTVSDPTTPVTTTARYTKIGRVVTVTIQFSSVTTTGASGRIQIDGLPFTNNSSLAGTGSVGFNGMATFTGSPFASLSASSSTIAMFASNSAGAYTAVTFNAGTTQDLWTSLTYTV